MAEPQETRQEKETRWATQRTARDQEQPLPAVIPQIPFELAVLIGVMLGRHQPAASPILIPHAPIANLKGLGGSVRRALVR